MKQLFKDKRPSAQKVCSAEPLTRGVSYMKRSPNQKREYVVCLCLNNKVVRRKFRTMYGAMSQMTKYQEKYGKNS